MPFNKITKSSVSYNIDSGKITLICDETDVSACYLAVHRDGRVSKENLLSLWEAIGDYLGRNLVRMDG